VRILLIDDNPVILHILRVYLRQYGDCDIARNGAEGLDAFTQRLDEQRPYDLICLDLQMPGLDGAAVLTRIRNLEEDRQTVKRAKILVVTATSEETIVAAVIAGGADSYLLKPVDPSRLREQLLELGLLDTAAEIRARALIDQFKKLCETDEIPLSQLKAMMKLISASSERLALRSGGRRQS
jgi:two-component system chemotaxis response regulator CheY